MLIYFTLKLTEGLFQPSPPPFEKENNPLSFLRDCKNNKSNFKLFLLYGMLQKIVTFASNLQHYDNVRTYYRIHRVNQITEDYPHCGKRRYGKSISGKWRSTPERRNRKTEKSQNNKRRNHYSIRKDRPSHLIRPP